MSFDIRPAIREGVGLFVGLAGGTQSGKTMSAMKIAQGIVGRDGRFGFVDTENRRSLHYAPRPGHEPDFETTFRFDALHLDEPFSSERYAEAVKALYDKGYKAIVVDSATHEHDGPGGYLDTQAEILDARVKAHLKRYPDDSEYKIAEKLTPLSWKEPKANRKRMMYTLLACSVRVPVIFCFRAEEKAFQSKDGKLVANNPPVWAPVCGKGMPFEMTVFFMLNASAPGVPKPLKLEDQHKPLFPLDKPLGEASGRLISRWAAGESLDATTAPTTAGADTITADEALALETRCTENGIDIARLKRAAKVERLSAIKVADHQRAKDWIDSAIAKAAA